MLLHGLTMHLTERGCCILTRKAPFSQGAKILLEITKNGVSLRTHAFVVYNVKNHFMGVCFVEMPPSQTAILAGWLRTATDSVNRRKEGCASPA
jgi:hypothetical protein